MRNFGRKHQRYLAMQYKIGEDYLPFYNNHFTKYVEEVKV